MKATPSPNAELLSELRTANHCCTLFDVMRNDFGGVACDEKEAQLIEIAIDLSARIYNAYWNTPHRDGTHRAAALSGQLLALVEAIPAINTAAASEPDDDLRGRLIDRIGWIQSAAHEIAENLVLELEALKTTEQAIAA